MADAARRLCETRIAGQVRPAEHFAEARELSVVADRHDHVAAGAREGLVGHHDGMGVAHAAGRLARQKVVEGLVGGEPHHAIQEREVDMLALPGLAPVLQRRQHGHARIHAGEDV